VSDDSARLLLLLLLLLLQPLLMLPPQLQCPQLNTGHYQHYVNHHCQHTGHYRLCEVVHHTYAV